MNRVGGFSVPDVAGPTTAAATHAATIAAALNHSTSMRPSRATGHQRKDQQSSSDGQYRAYRFLVEQ
jgi:orotate phosphoribosyltransferase